MVSKKLIEGNWFHGDEKKLDHFKDRHLDAEDYSRETNANGPGIYFTRLRWQANGYAGQNGFVYTATMDLDPSRVLEKKTVPSPSKLKRLIELCPEEERQTGFSNFGYDTPHGPAMEIALEYSQNNDTMLFAALSILHDFYGRSNNRDWAKAMVEIGYDAYLHKLPQVYHLVVYNPEIINIVSVKPAMKHIKEFGNFDGDSQK